MKKIIIIIATIVVTIKIIAVAECHSVIFCYSFNSFWSFRIRYPLKQHRCGQYLLTSRIQSQFLSIQFELIFFAAIMQSFCILVFCLICSFKLIWAQDTIFARGGTCMYRIRDHWSRCMDRQNARLTYERDNLEPIYTRAALTDSVNRISCCAYWDFIDCIERAAREHCPKEKHDMVAYSRQLGSAVPVEICQEQYSPKDCDSNYRSSAIVSTQQPFSLLITSIVILILFNSLLLLNI
uniref:Uncharacterized protein n=2 Tax=Sarcoptes scabiei TaxID=52283 RepID=A0A834VF68_SARSC